MSRKILVFVCTANTCRSPMAEVVLRARVKPEEWDVCSAGVYACDGAPASLSSIRAVQALGLDLSAHRSQRLTSHLVDRADLIVPMTRNHFWDITQLFPDSCGKVLMLGSFLVGEREEPVNVDDPYGSDQAAYNATRDIIAKAVERLAKYLEGYK